MEVAKNRCLKRRAPPSLRKELVEFLITFAWPGRKTCEKKSKAFDQWININQTKESVGQTSDNSVLWLKQNLLLSPQIKKKV